MCICVGVLVWHIQDAHDICSTQDAHDICSTPPPTSAATPSKPRNVRLSMITKTGAEVMWDASDSGGNLPIERYYIQVNTTEGVWREAMVEASGELVYMITGLNTFTVYQVQVHANNGKYNGTAVMVDFTSGEDSE